MTLSPMDNIMPRFYAKVIMCFRRPVNQDPREVNRILQEGLRRTIADIPSIAGKVFVLENKDGEARGRLELRTNTDWIPEILLKDFSEEIDYDDLVDNGIPQDDLDADRLFPPVGVLDLHQGVPVFIAQANYLTGGLLLGLGMFHSVIDGTSGMWLAKKWAAHTRQLQGLSKEDDGAALNILPGSTDYQILTKLWLAGGHKPLTAEEANRCDDLNLWRLLGLDPVRATDRSFSLDEQPGPGIPLSTPPMRSTIFYVSQKSFASLKAEATKEEDGSNMDLNISANDALMALLWRAIIRARFPTVTAAQAGIETTLDTTFDGRAHFSDALPWTYLGSLIFIGTTRMSLLELTSPVTSLAAVAREIRQAIDQISQERIHAAFGLASAVADYEHLTFPFATFAGAEVCITSWIAWSLFDLNFGNIFSNGGRPDLLRPPRREFDAVCRRCVVLPLQSHGGFEILVSLGNDEMDRLEKDSEFAKYARVVCH